MNVDIAERLAKRRREAGYSQESLAEKLGVSRQAVSKWERSESSPDTDNLIALARLYGVSLDDLLYVDESFEDDVVFEAADRASERNAQASNESASSFSQAEKASNFEQASDVPNDGTQKTASNNSSVKGKKEKVSVGPGGIFVNDGDDYVHVSWRDGVHIKDSKEGDEVHIGWEGVHVKEQKSYNSNSSGACSDKDDSSVWEDGSVVINGKKYESWQDAHNEWGYKKEGHHKMSAWSKFPFPLLVILIYILLGVFANVWGPSLFIFLLIPLYYMLISVIETRRISAFLAGVYPVLATAFFLYMAFMMNQPHPAWVIFLTIPLVEWLIHSVVRTKKIHKAKKKNTDDVIEVEVEINDVEGK